jgi:glycosyltransferase involved in cell wall biosynthesis
MFYATYNIRLFIFLLFTRQDALFANDLDTLPANYLASVLKRKPLVYDSHEYYTGVPELENRPMVKKIWKTFERWIFPRLKTIITVNHSIAGLYEKEYGKKLSVIRNIPAKLKLPDNEKNKTTLKASLGLPIDKNIVILQGAGINIDRGAEEAVEAMQYLENEVLLIIGGGDVVDVIQQLIIKHHLEKKVILKPRMPYPEMMNHTVLCDLGLTIDKGTNINYQYSLPNKIFDYIHAGIPVLASRLPEVEKIVKGSDVGDFIENHDPMHIAGKISEMLSGTDKLAGWKKNLQLAAQELTWEEELKKFPNIIDELR